MAELDIEKALQIGEKYLMLMKQEISSNISTTGRRASGRSQASLRVEMTPTGGTLYGRKYFQGLEIGRPGGRVPYRFHDIIYRWMSDKGILSAFKKPKSAAWLIARKIQREGTALHKAPQYDVFTPPMERLKKEMKAEIGAVIKFNLSTELKKSL